MKITALWIVFAMCMLASHAAYDFSHHDTGHELAETLINEPQSIFVIFFFKKSADDKINKATDDLRANVRQKLLGQDVYYTEVDLTEAETAKKYKEVINMLGVYPELLDTSPVVAMSYNRAGYWIHGDGVPKETAETIQSYVRAQEQEAKKSGSAPVSFGGSSRHSSDRSIAVGGQY